MEDIFSRTAMLLGETALNRLASVHVAVFGLGGVGSYVVEALARSGIGALTLVDHDIIVASNINRQLFALHSTLGRQKSAVAAERVRDINPQCQLTERAVFFSQESLADFDFKNYDYVVDAIDTVTAKLLLITACAETKTPLISAMGAGNKLDPTRFQITDIFKTEMDPLARVMRKELRKRGISSLKVVYSQEEPSVIKFLASGEQSADGLDSGEQSSDELDSGERSEDGLDSVIPATGTAEVRETCSGCEVKSTGYKKQSPGSVAYVPSVAGLIIAGEVVRDLCELG